MRKSSSKGRLTLHRETLRNLEDAPLRKVIGACVPVSIRTCGHPCSADCTVPCTVTSCATVIGLNC